MTEITHNQARTLLQAAADRPLGLAERSALDAHLAACNECGNYAGQLARLESDLRETLQAKWDGYRPSLNLQAIKNPAQAKPVWKNVFSQTNALGKVTLLTALLLGYLLVANLVGAGMPVSERSTPTALPTPNQSSSVFADSPTPSTQSATLQLTSLSCETILYIVQVDDTLDSIAVRYGITKEDILEYNKDQTSLFSNTVFTGMELIIPLCRSTPSFTASIPANTLTITPIGVTILPDQPE